MNGYQLGGLAVVVSLLAPPATLGQAEQAPLELVRLSDQVQLDGMPDEPVWATVPPLPLTMYLPVFEGQPTQRTVIRVAYDDAYLYAAGWFYDTDPAGIRVNSLYRDRWNGDDAFAIYVDAFNDNRNAKWFGTTPAGMRFDLLVSQDGQSLNDSWDAFWDARTRVTDEGWFAEVRIPFSTLGFQAVDGKAVMGLTVTRLVSRLNERVTFPAIDPRFQFRQPSVAHDIVLTDVHSGTPIYVTPYALAGMERTATGQEAQREFPYHMGVDFRAAMSSELTLDLTANTDFAQVEADDQQVNLDRFSLFFPEKRRFFQERSELFDFTMGSSGGRLFHSRHIGLAPGTRVPVLGGGRLVGRVGEWDIAALDMQTGTADSVPAENFGVVRLRRGVFNDHSHAGMMVTSRLSDEGRNFAYGLDGDFRVFGNDYLSVRWAQTFDRDEPTGRGFFDRAQHYLTWRRAVTRGFTYQVSTTRSGSAYHPAVGFLPRRDFTTANAIAEYYVFTDQHPVFRRVWPGALAFSIFRNSDGVLESGQYAIWLQWETKSGGGGWIEPKVFREDVADPFVIGGQAEIPAGRYTFADLQFVLLLPTGSRLRTNIDARAGTYFDGTRAQIILSPTWNLSRHLEVGGDYQFTRLRFDDRDQGVDVHLARLRVRAAVDARASGNALVQYNSTTDRLTLNFRFRFNAAEGTDLWIVYDETLDTERPDDGLGIRPPLSTARALTVKYTRTFRF